MVGSARPAMVPGSARLRRPLAGAEAAGGSAPGAAGQPPHGLAAEQGQHEAEAAEEAGERQGETAPHLSRHRHEGLP